MSNELNIGLGQTGLTVTAQLYTAGAASGSPISCPEISTSGIYTGTMAGAAGTYQIAFLAGGVLKGYGQIIWDGTAEVTANTTTQTAIADALLDRDMATGADSGSPTVRTVRQALRFLRNKWSIAGTTLTVTKEDDTAASWTATVTAAPGADPISGSDPA